MRGVGRLLGALILVLAAFACATPAEAQATRTWVSGVGDDANPCSRTAPCKTFAGAISKTATAGEINCLDPGGFGALTITKAIAIICQAGTAGVLVSGTNGITISAAATDAVYLEGLDFEGLNSSPNGIQVNTAAQVSVVNCRLRGFTTAGIDLTPSSGSFDVQIIDSVIADNPGTGILAKPTGSGGLRVVIDRSRVVNSGGDGIASTATLTSGGIKVSVRDSESFHNVGDGFTATSNGAPDQMIIDSSSATDNAVGIAASGAGAVVRFTRSSVIANPTGVLQVSPGTVLSYQTNSVDGNAINGSFGTIPSE